MVHILQLTDTHLFADPQGALYTVNTRDALLKVVAHARQTLNQIDVVLLTGDLVHDESADGYSELKNIVNGLGSSIFYLPGNHDDPAVMQQILGKCTGSRPVSFDTDHWSIVLLDSTVRGKVEGFLAEDTLKDLESLLRNNSEKHVLIALHHHIIDVQSPWLDLLNLRNHDQLTTLLEKFSNVRLVINGHVHHETDVVKNGIRYLGTPATCFQFAVKNEKGGIDGRPPAYRHVILNDDGSLVTTVHFVS